MRTLLRYTQLTLISTGLLLFIDFSSCKDNAADTSMNAQDASLSEFILEAAPGKIPWQTARKMDTNGNLLTEGFVEQGNKTGTWVTYHTSFGSIRSIESYVNGKKHGLQTFFTQNGSVELMEHFLDGEKNGLSRTFSGYNVMLTETNYLNGKKDGVHREYHSNGKVLKEVHFTADQIHGDFKQWDDKGNLILHYKYAKGEKTEEVPVSSGQ